MMQIFLSLGKKREAKSPASVLADVSLDPLGRESHQELQCRKDVREVAMRLAADVGLSDAESLNEP